MSTQPVMPLARSLLRSRARAHFSNAAGALVVGLLLIALGAFFTALFSQGSTVFVTVGAFVGGAVQVIRGIYYFFAGLFAFVSSDN
jgi:hypothetical protein